ncbi:hypothetical protein NRF20_00705 [Streptomyces sp. R-74717]|uniref:hypothetical protein n=1 Tax=Streptomyces TaxID=1883 RepID=UPI0037A0688B
MPQERFALLMEVIREYVKADGGRFRLDLEPREKELFAEEVQQEVLNLLGLISARQLGHEDRADHVVAHLGHGEHAKAAMSLVPPDVADDPDKLCAMRDKLDTQQHQRKQDEQTVEDIARASGMTDG